MLPSSMWRRKLVSFGSAIALAIRETVARITDGGNVKLDSDRIADYAIEGITVFFISAAMVILIIVIWAEVFFAAVWFLLFLLSEAI
jgi:hypothetical protein